MQRLLIDTLLMVMFLSILVLPISAMGWVIIRPQQQSVLSTQTERKETTMPARQVLEEDTLIQKQLNPKE